MPCAGPFWRHLCFASSKSWSRNGFVRNSIAPAFRHGDISMSGDKNNRHAHAALRQSLLEIQAAHSRQSNVENKATGNIRPLAGKDRKSTRLNSSHGYISYAVFCLKKKTPCPYIV